MYASPPARAPTVPTTPAFTLGSALRWLGHACPDHRCSQPIDALPTSMWFLLRGGHRLPVYPLQAVLVVDLAETSEPPARIRRRGSNRHDLIDIQMNEIFDRRSRTNVCRFEIVSPR
jgi:hypothetical protein